MKRKFLALVLALLMLPVLSVFAAEAGWADSLMEGIYTVLGGDESITIRSFVSPGGRGGYCEALYAVELAGDETKEELDAIAVELVKSGAEPVWGGSKHCIHFGEYTVEPEYTVKASARRPGSYLYVCYAFRCDGGNYNHLLTPYYERISTMSIRITEKSQPMALRFVLADRQGRELASMQNGGAAEIALGTDAYLQILSDVAYPNEEIIGVRADFPADQAADAFAFDPATMSLKPLCCGSGTVTVTLRAYLTGNTRTETVTITVPCAPQAEPETVLENTCTEDGLAVYRCHGYGLNCETSFDEVVLPALGHELFSVNQYILKPTATQPGIGMGTCSRCGLIGVEEEVPPIFSDVTGDAFYSQPLDYCHAKGWVSGTSASTFAPGNACIRAQVVTFLWRAAGSPKSTSTVNPFVDVKESDFCYDAVLWAVENGITAGADATHFNPLGVCNRAQVVTFLWSACGKPQPQTGEHQFRDVQAGSWYEPAVLWAVEEGISSGVSATAFGPGVVCNRAQIVTFLYKAYAE
ncbi:MAG: S-layer homology domain-containing protein [Oscillospiraceae bacterium]|nr:S-layer homology domain-containing protein [Oscillospiraceae bacterium]